MLTHHYLVFFLLLAFLPSFALSWAGELHGVGIQGVVIVVLVYRHAEHARPVGTVAVGFGCAGDEGEVRGGVQVVVGRSPFLGQPIAFQHPDNFGHLGPVGRQVLGAQERHLEHLSHVDPVIVAPQLFIHQKFYFLLLMYLLHLSQKTKPVRYFTKRMKMNTKKKKKEML